MASAVPDLSRNRFKKGEKVQIKLHAGQAQAWNSTSRFTLMLAGTGGGKLLRLSTPLPTPDGWVQMGEIKIGDTVFDESGTPCKVTGVFDSLPKRAYRLRFSDSTEIVAGGEHQWVTWSRAERKAYSRSPYETITEFPDNWPQWKLKRLVSGSRFTPAKVEAALAMHRSEPSRTTGYIASQLGMHAPSLERHLLAGTIVERLPEIYPDSPGPQVRTTQEIVDTLITSDGNTNHCIPTCGPLQTVEQEMLVDPYLLGYWLGDGTAANGAFTCDPEDQTNLIAHLERGLYRPRVLPSSAKVVGTRGLMADLRRIGVLNNKHVPTAYLRASAAQRLALLQGLMDSDGYANDTKGCVEFCNTNYRLVQAVVELARSLGQKPVCTESRAMLYGVDHGPKWRVGWRPTFDVFRLPRKRDRIQHSGSQGLRNQHRMIISAEEIPPEPMRCIMVDSPNHMYLAGDGMIPTHNSYFSPIWLAREIQRRDPQGTYLCVAPNWRMIRRIMVPRLVEHFKALRVFSKYRRSDGEIYLTTGAVIFLGSAEVPNSLEGVHCEAGIGDEPGQWSLEAWEVCQRRVGFYKGRFLLTTTPYSENWIKSEFVDRANAGDKDYTVVNFPSWYNPDYDHAEYLRAKRTLPGWKFNMYYNGLITRPEGLVYDTRYDDLCVDELPAGSDKWPWAIGFDHGWNNPTAAVIAVINPANDDHYVIGEHYMREASLDIHADALRAWKDLRPFHMRGVFYDKSADAIVTELANKPGISGWSWEPAPNAVLPGILEVGGRAKAGKLFFLRGASPHLRDEWESYRWAKRKQHEEVVRDPTSGEVVEMRDEVIKTNDHLCFPGYTKVATSQGLRDICTIHPGDLVWTRTGLRPVLESKMTSASAEVYSLGDLHATRDHPIWTANRGWVPLGHLEPIDVLLKESNETVSVKPLGPRAYAGRMPVYSLTVEGDHEFFAAGYLVKNCDALRYLEMGLKSFQRPGVRLID